MKGISRNRTGIEDWIVEKAIHRRRSGRPPFVYPYDLGWKDNFRQVQYNKSPNNGFVTQQFYPPCIVNRVDHLFMLALTKTC